MDLIAKLNAIQHDLKAPKSNFNSFGKYKYRSIEDIKTRLESVQYEKIRMVNITSPISQPPDFPGIQKYLRAPANISLIFLD